MIIESVEKFQTKESTKWGCDTVVRYSTYSNQESAEQGVILLRKGNWYVNSAYPHPHKTIDRNFIVVAVRRADPTTGGRLLVRPAVKGATHE